MSFTTKDVRPAFEAKLGPTRRFVVKGDIAFAVLASDEPVFGSVIFSGGQVCVERCVSLISAPVPLSVIPPQWFTKAASEFIPHMAAGKKRDWWTTLVAASKALGGNCGHIQLDEQHPFAQHTGAVNLIVHGNRVDGTDQQGNPVASWVKPGLMQALTAKPGPIISWS